MDSFATAEDYTARFGDAVDDDILEQCLLDATYAICAVLDKYGIDYYNPNEEFSARLMSVCRSVANRIYPYDNSIPMGVTQTAQAAGGYTQSFSYSPGYSTPKLLPSELSLLGISGSGRIIQAHNAVSRAQ